MGSKISNELVASVNKNTLSAIGDLPNRVPNVLKKSFYFKGRKAPEIACEIIKALTSPNDIILDPFFGGGSFILSALDAHRKIFGIELDNYTYDIVSMLFTEVDTDLVNEYFAVVEESAKQIVMDLYRTTCCGMDNYISKLYFDPENQEYYNPVSHREIIDDENVILTHKCENCGKKRKKFDDYDFEVLKRSEQLDTSGFPDSTYIENSRINITTSTGADKYDRIFTNRGKFALLTIQEAISKLPDTLERHLLQHALVSSLPLARIAQFGSSTDILYHVVPQKAQETNVWSVFNTKYKDILNFKKQYSNYQVSDVKSNSQYKLLCGSYRTILDKKYENKFDLVYTDFPYTDQVPYLERNQLFRVWLNHFCDGNNFVLSEKMLNEEIVLTNAPTRKNKGTIDLYFQDINNIFATLQKCLKVEKFAIFTIKLGKASHIRTYLEIVNLAKKNGFEYVSRFGIEKNDPTLRKQSAYANTFMNEIIVIFQKLKDEDRYFYVGDVDFEFIFKKEIYKILLKQEPHDSFTLTKAVNYGNELLIEREYIPNEKDHLKMLKIVSENFLVGDNGTIYIDNNRLYLDIEDNKTLFVKLYDLVPLYIRKLLSENGKFVLEDLYMELTASISGSSNTIMQILDNTDYKSAIRTLILNYCEISNGYYVKKRVVNEKHDNSEDISQYTGSEFELLVKELLIKEGYFNITIVGGAGDRGVDLVASILLDKDVKKVIFQCKRWISNVGSEPIQRLFAEREHHSYSKAICITTSDFTTEGKRAAKDFNVEIWNGIRVMELLNHHFPQKYYNRALNIPEESNN
ncbi:MAG: DUF2034 domain-containing protein [Clostridiaceae bacterium]|nr:DUF2034 domain-containing protein [Clostridiaceae bacterium]